MKEFNEDKSEKIEISEERKADKLLKHTNKSNTANPDACGDVSDSPNKMRGIPTVTETSLNAELADCKVVQQEGQSLIVASSSDGNVDADNGSLDSASFDVATGAVVSTNSANNSHDKDHDTNKNTDEIHDNKNFNAAGVFLLIPRP